MKLVLQRKVALEIREAVSILAATTWAHLIILAQWMDYYNFDHDYDTFLNYTGTSLFLAELLCIVSFLLNITARIKQQRVGWGLAINLLFVILPTRFLIVHIFDFLNEHNIYLLDLLT